MDISHHSQRLCIVPPGKITVVVFFSSLLLSKPVFANTIIPDNTLGVEQSVVVPLNPTVDLITGGAVREQNLFHSFEEFSISDINGAYFITGDGAITNIFTRITGTAPSEIQGILGTRFFNGGGFLPTDANLYLINPNGIVFGENAVLDVGGSFAATTASGVQFDEMGNFNAVNPQVPSGLLTIAPSAYFFAQLPAGNIASRSVRPDVTNPFIRGLRVPDGEALTLLGGNVEVDGGSLGAGLIAFGGRLELGAFNDTGVVTIGDNQQLQFPETGTRGDIHLHNQALLEARRDGTGQIALTGRNLTVQDNSLILTGDLPGSPPLLQSPGDIRFEATEQTTVQQSFIGNRVVSDALNDGGNIVVNTGSFQLIDGAGISVSTFGLGNAGHVQITATEQVLFDQGNVFSQVGAASSGNGGNIDVVAHSIQITNDSRVSTGTQSSGNAGDVTITTNTLQVTNGSGVDASTTASGGAGDVIITAAEEAIFATPAPDGLVSRVSSAALPDATGTGGDIEITTRRLQISDKALVNAGTFGSGDGGDVTIHTEMLQVAGGARINASTFGAGNSGNIYILATESAVFEGTDTDDVPSGAFSTVGSALGFEGTGQGGNIEIITDHLRVADRAFLGTGTTGSGGSGDILITANNNVEFAGGFAFSAVEQGASGQGGDIKITSEAVRLTRGGALNSTTSGQGDAGDIVINAQDSVTLTGSDGEFISMAASGVLPGAIGHGGNIEITTGTLHLLEGAQLTGSTVGPGQAGDVVVRASGVVVIDGTSADRVNTRDFFADLAFEGQPASGITSGVGPDATGNGGKIDIVAGSLQLTNGALISTSTLGQGDSGNIFVTTTDDLFIAGTSVDGQLASVIFSGVTAIASGNGGDIEIRAGNLRIVGPDGASILPGLVAASEGGPGNAGDIVLIVKDTINISNGDISTFAAQSSGGAISVTADLILLTGDADIQTFVESGSGGGGNIAIVANLLIALDDSDILAFAADGRGGDIDLSQTNFFGNGFQISPAGIDPGTLDWNDRVDINASGGLASGTILIPDTSFVENSLNSLPDSIVPPDRLLPGSCIARTSSVQGSLVVTGGEGLPTRPGESSVSEYSTGEVRVSRTGADASTTVWQDENFIAEPTGVFELTDGRLVLSQRCNES